MRYCKIFGNETSRNKKVLKYIAIGVDVDHVHLHMMIPPKYVVSMAVETIKNNTRRHLSLKFRFLKESALGQYRDILKRIFRLDSWHK